MKVLITSPDALIDNETTDFFEGVIDALNQFLAKDDKNMVLVISVVKERLESIPENFETLHIARIYRGSPKLGFCRINSTKI
jgi:hypothetical protein